MNRRTWKHLVWIPINGLVIFGLPYLLVNIMGLSKNVYPVFLAIITILYLVLYSRFSSLHLMAFLRSGWALGLIMGVFFGLALLSLISSPLLSGSHQYGLLPALWNGTILGLSSALLISVLPFVISWRALAGTNPGNLRKIGVTIAAVSFITAMSLLQSLGLSGFKGNIQDNFKKNLIASVPTIISGSPLAAPITTIFLQVSESLANTQQTPDIDRNGIETAKSTIVPGGIN